MISFIKGKLFEVKTDSIIIENNNIGYEIFCCTKDISFLSKELGNEIFIHTFLQHKEDVMILYGFSTEKMKKGFFELIKVDGIGPKLALKILSFYEVDILFGLIHSEEIDELKKIPGVGPKMASKIIFDLKGVLPSLEETVISGFENDLILALVNLGFNEKDIKENLKKLNPISDNFEVEFKKLLKIMAGKQ